MYLMLGSKEKEWPSLKLGISGLYHQALVDTGATFSAMSENFFLKFGLSQSWRTEAVSNAFTANGQKLKFSCGCWVPVMFTEKVQAHLFLRICSELSVPLVVGNNVLGELTSSTLSHHWSSNQGR